MKKLYFALSLLFAATTALTGCRKSSGGGDDEDETITVNFYHDYNQVAAGEIYDTQYVKNGSKVKEPTKPTESPFPEFPVFLGWSKKEVIDDKKDLWNFSKDKVKTDIDEFPIYGIWVAEGEN